MCVCTYVFVCVCVNVYVVRERTSNCRFSKFTFSERNTFFFQRSYPRCVHFAKSNRTLIAFYEDLRMISKSYYIYIMCHVKRIGFTNAHANFDSPRNCVLIKSERWRWFRIASNFFFFFNSTCSAHIEADISYIIIISVFIYVIFACIYIYIIFLSLFLFLQATRETESFGNVGKRGTHFSLFFLIFGKIYPRMSFP